MRMPPLTPRVGAQAAEDDTFPLITAPSPRQRIPPFAAPQRSPPSRRWTTKAVLCALLVASVGSCIYFVERTSLVLQTSEAEPATHVHAESVPAATALTTGQAQALRVAPEVTDSGVTTSPPPPVPVFDVLTDGDYTEYSCVGWRQTGGCSPDGPREPSNDRPCDVRVYGGASGFCEIEHRTTGVRRRVLPRHCTSLPKKSGFECNSFSDLLTYGRKALHYTHDRNFSYTKNQDELLQTNNLTAAPHTSFFERGIAMVIYEELVLSAYTSIRWMRQQGLSLPIEMWYRHSETDPSHPLLQVLVANYSVYLREFEDPLATGFYTKLHAVFYSAFDSVLLLDADNFAVRDPSFLFESREFTSSGALFWPDFWKPDNTLFNVHNKSLVWEVFDLPFVDMFEQESGQVLIDRRRHMKALNALMYYGFSLPRIHEELRLVWGDKDLFRFAWMKTGSSFEMVSRPPGSAGKVDGATGAFCGLTMVQHEPLGDVLFLHRNMLKIRESSRQSVWTHVEQFKRESPLSEYRIGWARVFKDFSSCWGKSTEWEAFYTLESMESVGLGDMEPMLLRFADEGVEISTRSEHID